VARPSPFRLFRKTLIGAKLGAAGVQIQSLSKPVLSEIPEKLLTLVREEKTDKLNSQGFRGVPGFHPQ
jgi:hypothetical protein